MQGNLDHYRPPQHNRDFSSRRNRERDTPEDLAAAAGWDFKNAQKQQTHIYYSNFPNLKFAPEMHYETKARRCLRLLFFFQTELLTTRGLPLHF